MAKFTEAQAVYRLYDKSDRNELTSFEMQQLDARNHEHEFYYIVYIDIYYKHIEDKTCNAIQLVNKCFKFPSSCRLSHL